MDGPIRTVIAVQFVFMLGLGVLLPILPLFALSFGISYGAAGVIASAFGLARLLADVIAGPVVDRRGERSMAVGGICLLAVCAVLTGLAPNYPLAVLAWALGGAGSAVTFAAQYSYLMKVVPKDRMARTLGIFYGSFNAGIVAGGFLGGVIASVFGLRAPFFVYASLLALAAFLYLRFVPEPRRPGVADLPFEQQEALVEREAPLWRRGGRKISALFRIRGFWMVTILNLAYMWMVASVFNTLVPLFAQDELGMTPSGIGGLFAAVVAAEFLILYPAGSLADRFGRKAVVGPALVGLAVLVAVAGTATSVLAFTLILSVLGLASGFAGVPPAAMLADIVPDADAGTGVGIFRFAGDLAFFVAPVTTGLVAEAMGFPAAFGLSALPILVALAFVIRTPDTLKLAEAQRTSSAR